jgi:hypothetical protein
VLEREPKRAEFKPRAAKRDQEVKKLKGRTRKGIAKISTS